VTHQGYQGLSLWLETCGDDLAPRAPLPGDLDVDVAIVGAGFTGLWTAYYLTEADHGLRIAVLESEIAGFGASGRNGGWMSALFPSSRDKLAGLAGSSRDAAARQTLAMRESIDEAGRVIDKEGIDCDFHKGGTLVFARTAAQLRRARADVDAAREWGDTDDDIRLLDADETRAMARATDVRGATYTPHCARIHPARLARGLARVVEARGVAIYEQTPVTAISPGLVETPIGRVRADRVIRATEGYTPGLRGNRRTIAPVYSLVVATEPLPDSVWSEIGLAGRPTFADHRNLIIYGQRTEDGRIVFGGRGAPYHFSSRTRPRFDGKERVFSSLRNTLTDLFPALAESAFTHAWGGPLGIARDWMASVGFDRDTGIGWAGGYVGDGVTTTNLAGRTLAHLVVEEDSDLTTLPWVNHRSPKWEPEPVRWIGINAGLLATNFADVEESLTRRPSLIARAMAPFTGGSD
jgi:glycine/D-amino acid oxidase-like deaminating enzyme